MIDLNKIAQKLNEASLKREENGAFGDDRGITGLLKHCAGEVIEAADAYRLYVLFKYAESYCIPYEADDFFNKQKAFISELADVIACILIIAARENIDIEYALSQCLVKNMARANNKGDKK